MKKYLIYFLIAAAMVLSLTACGSKKTEQETETTAKEEEIPFSTGTWDGMTFTNPWLKLSITLPEKSYIYTEADMALVLGEGQKILVNNGNFTDSQLKEAEKINVYDFMAALPDGGGNVQLTYENIRYTTMGKGVSEEDYLKAIASQLSAITNMKFKIGSQETVTIADRTFVKLPVALEDGTSCQDYYSLRQGDYMATLTVTYPPQGKSVADDLISGIRATE